MKGMIVGGWGFVWAAYGWTATVLTVYGISIIVRLRGERARAAREGLST